LIWRIASRNGEFNSDRGDASHPKGQSIPWRKEGFKGSGLFNHFSTNRDFARDRTDWTGD
jgi:hypothetical protein